MISGFRVTVFRFLALGFRFQVSGFRFHASDSMFLLLGVMLLAFKVAGVHVSGFWLQSSEFRFGVSGLRFLGSGFRVSGFWIQVFVRSGGRSRRSRCTHTVGILKRLNSGN